MADNNACMHHAEDSSHISQRLEIGRKALETLASIASQLENAKDGLVRSAYLTSNVEDLPPGVRRLWESLDKNIMAMPAKELGAELMQIEQHLSVRLVWLTPFIEKICAEESLSDDARIHDVRAQMQDLARLAGTALAIRILGHRKNYKFPSSTLPIHAEELREKAQQVKKIERVHKLRVINHMRDMMSATTGMLQSASLDSATRKMLKSVMHDLQLNLKHLANGGSFASLPVPIEEVEMQEPEEEAAELALVEDKSVEKTAEQNPEKIAAASASNNAPVAAPISASRASTSSRTSTAKLSRSTSLPNSSTVTAPAPLPLVPHLASHAIVIKRNSLWKFCKQLYVWVRTPLNVTWSEARLVVADEDDL